MSSILHLPEPQLVDITELVACLSCSNELEDAELGDFHQGCSCLMAITHQVPVLPLASFVLATMGPASGQSLCE